jgi:hypothetical protein
LAAVWFTFTDGLDNNQKKSRMQINNLLLESEDCSLGRERHAALTAISEEVSIQMDWNHAGMAEHDGEAIRQTMKEQR